MKQTENLKLNKIELTDSADITVINPNWDSIDNEITKIKTDKADTSYVNETVATQLGGKVDKETGKGLSTNDFTTAEKTKLNGITTNATKTESSSTNGKIKINGIETTVYTHPSGTNPHSTTKADVGLGNVDNTSDLNKPISNATQKALDGKADKTHVSDTIAHITASERTTWNGKASTAVVTTSANGLMSKDDKIKLNGIATGANNYTHPTTSGNKHIPSGGSSGQILRWSADGTAVWGADNNTTYGVVSKTANGLAPQLPNETTTTKYLRQDGTWAVPPNTNTTYGVATTSANGLMSSGDKTKLDGIATGANKTVLNNTVTSTSTTEAATANAVKTAYDKANHTHPYAPTTHSHEFERLPFSYKTTNASGYSTLYYDGAEDAFKFERFYKTTSGVSSRKTYTIANKDGASGGASVERYNLNYLNGWQKWEFFPGFPDKEVAKIGDVVFIHTVIAGGSANSSFMASLPKECIPQDNMHVFATYHTGSTSYTQSELRITTDGTIMIFDNIPYGGVVTLNFFYYLK